MGLLSLPQLDTITKYLISQVVFLLILAQFF
jgi:hypothetical protein